MSHTQHDTEYEDVAIDSIAGLDLLLVNVKDTYRDGLDVEESLGKPGDTARWNSVFTDIYLTLQKKIITARDIVSTNNDLQDNVINEIQDLYDRFIALHSEIGTSWSDVEFKPKAKPEPQPKPAPTKPTIQKTEIQKEVVATPKPPQIPEETKQELIKLKKISKNSFKFIKTSEEKLKKALESRELTEAEKLLFDELSEIRERAEVIKDKAFSVKLVGDSSELEKIRQYIKVCNELKRNSRSVYGALLSNENKAVLPKVQPPEDKKRKTMAVEVGDTSEVKVAIDTKKKEQKTPDTEDQQKKKIINHAPLPKPEKKDFAPRKFQTYMSDPVDQTIHPPTEQITKPASIHETASLTERYLLIPEYRSFLETHYSSPSAYERILDSFITKVENTHVDPIERWLGEAFASPFEFLKDMSIGEIESFKNRSSLEVRADLKRENIKYECYLEWIDLLSEMITFMEVDERMTYGELFARFMVEQEMLARSE